MLPNRWKMASWEVSPSGPHAYWASTSWCSSRVSFKVIGVSPSPSIFIFSAWWFGHGRFAIIQKLPCPRLLLNSFRFQVLYPCILPGTEVNNNRSQERNSTSEKTLHPTTSERKHTWSQMSRIRTSFFLYGPLLFHLKSSQKRSLDTLKIGNGSGF